MKTYKSLDEMPVLNWHLLNKNNDFSQLLKVGDIDDADESELIDAYDKILLESGGLKFTIQYAYYNAMRAFLKWSKDRSPISEDRYNTAFFDKYLAVLNKEVEEDLISSFAKFAAGLEHEEQLKERILVYAYHNFTFKENKSDLFSESASLSTILGYQINLKDTTVSAYKSLIKQANKIIENRRKKK